MESTLVYDANAVVPVPQDVSARGAAGWARAAAAELARSLGADRTIEDGIAADLSGLADAVQDDLLLLLVVGAGGAVRAPLRIFVAPEMSRQEQADFLWSSTALLPATPRLTETRGFGTGFSSTLAQRERGADFATRRWLFAGRGTTLGALLGPVAPYALAFVEDAAEAVLAESRLEGFVPRDEPARLEELMAAVSRPGDDWEL